MAFNKKQWARDYRALLKALGLCIECKQDATAARCDRCLLRNRESARRSKARKAT